MGFNQSEGKIPSWRDLVKITCRMGATSEWSLFRNKGLMQSGPGALSGFRPCSNFMMPFSGLWWPDSWRSWTFCWHSCLSVRGDLGVNTDWNWQLRRFAFWTLSVYSCSSFLRGELPWYSWLQFLRKEKSFLVFGPELTVSAVSSMMPTRLCRYVLYADLVIQSTSYFTFLKSWRWVSLPVDFWIW